MKSIGIVGASGFLGGELAKHFEMLGWRVIRFSRSSRNIDGQEWRQLGEGALTQLDALVNLAGASIDKRWTANNKKDFYDSRIGLTESIARWISQIPLDQGRPKLWLNASAVGVYGDRGDELLEENSDLGEGYLAWLCREWESAAHGLDLEGCRIIHPRIGVVLGKQSKAWRKMLKAFRFGVGGKLAGGEQWFPWVHIDDLVQAMAFLVVQAASAGVYNIVAPNSITNAEFTSQLGSELRRPTFCAVPRFILRIILGEFADALTASQRVKPKKLETLGFCWSKPTMNVALKSLVGSRAP